MASRFRRRARDPGESDANVVAGVKASASARAAAAAPAVDDDDDDEDDNDPRPRWFPSRMVQY